MSTEQKDAGKMEFWAIVEQMGHRKLAGHVTEVPMGLLRIDVPEVRYQYSTGYGDERKIEDRTIAAYTTFIGPSTIYAITPCTEEVAKAAARRFCAKPLEIYDIQPVSRLALPSPEEFDRDNDDF